MAQFVEGLCRAAVRVTEGNRRRVYAWRNVKPNVSASDIDAVLNALLSLSQSTPIEKFLTKQMNIV